MSLVNLIWIKLNSICVFLLTSLLKKVEVKEEEEEEDDDDDDDDDEYEDEDEDEEEVVFHRT